MFLLRLLRHNLLKSALALVALVAALPITAVPAGATTPALVCVSLTSCSSYTPTQIGQGYNGTLSIIGTGFANNGSNVSLSTNATGVTFSNANESSASAASATITVAPSATPGWYGLTLSDGTNTGLFLSNAFYVDAAPTISSASPASLANTTSATITLTGTNFETNPSVAFASTVDGTKLTVTNVTQVSSTQITATVTAQNNVTTNPATLGSYNVEVTNADGGYGQAPAFSVTAAPSTPSITATSPSSLAVPNAGTATTTVTLTGVDFVNGATVTASGVAGVTAASTLVTSATSATVSISVPTGTSTGELNLTVTNPNNATSTLTGAVGINEPSSATGNAPVVTAVSSLPALTPSSTGTITITGSNFPATSNVSLYAGTSTTASGVTCATSWVSATQLSCALTNVSNAAIAGPVGLVVNVGADVTNPSALFPNALTVSGPVLVSATPANVASGASATLTLAGTGFAQGDTASVTGATYTANSLSVTSSTTASLAFTNAVGPNITVTITGPTSVSAPVNVATVAQNPSVTAVSYANNASDMGLNVHNEPITIVGTGFLPNATVTFPSASGVTAIVATVTPTTILADLTVPSSVPQNTYPFTVTNANGGSVTTTTVTVKFGADPTVTSITPNSVQAASTHTLTILGTGFVSGATAQASSGTSLVTLGATTFVSSTELTVSATFAALSGATALPVSVSVVNPDFGTASASVSVNPSPTISGTYNVKPNTLNQELTVSGTGFSTAGITATSSDPSYQVSVVSSTSTSALLLVTTSTTTSPSTKVTLTMSDASTVSFTLSDSSSSTTTTPVVLPAAKALAFGAKIIALTPALKKELTATAKTLIRGSTVTVTGYAKTAKLAVQRAREVATYLKTHTKSITFTCVGVRSAQGRVVVRTTSR